ncbi:MAG: hypothetical protein CM15mP86_07090 [Gammaproteobacteria bacterium]|nr:MAG: hypothetical protein CM15mP86_07090 [Gammaproteobacteria bacterium]
MGMQAATYGGTIEGFGMGASGKVMKYTEAQNILEKHLIQEIT